ncbi:MAG: hypothetical protein LLG45_06685 [Actinomycetia bacterium]|nr:hypothetical protein [Actinomycetes bacterium]
MKKILAMTVVMLAAMLMVAAPAMAGNLITSGDFEAGSTGFTSEYTLVTEANNTSGGESGLGTLDVEGAYAIGLDPYGYHRLWESFSDHTNADGTGHMMIVNGNEDATPPPVVYQTTVTGLIPGRDYEFSFWGATSYPTAYAQLELWINDEYVDTYDAPESLATWAQYVAPAWTATSDTGVIKLVDVNTAHTGNDFALDDISLEIINYPSDITSIKFYDTNMDGLKTGDTESGWLPIPFWRIELWGAGGTEPFRVTYTGADGWYMFEDVPVGDYIVKEGVGGGCWVQTFPEAGFHTTTVTGDGATIECQNGFGNVCKRCVTGYTMGFWSNKNGKAALKAVYGTDCDAPVIVPEPYAAVSINEVLAMANLANARDMCVMLKAQYVAHWLNVNVKHADYAGAAVIIDGEVVDYDAELAAAVAFIEACEADPTLCDRTKAGEYKDFFDGLNNNRFPVVEYYENMCDVPWASED